MTLNDHRIKPEHRQRAAVVYVRQSDPEQVRRNRESTRVQLGLREQAVALGWLNPVAIQDDLGISAQGYADRPGFRRMMSEVALQKVGIILCVDASRLSRNSRDWAHLFELCGYFDTLVADLDQVYDLSIANDRLVLGIKGTMAEMELSILRTRLRTGTESKAARGELKFIVPPGYTHDHAGRIVLDPDRRVQAAIKNMFHQFDRCTSLRQLAIWYHDTKTIFPVRRVRKTRTIAWQIPTRNTLRKLLQHPIYAGTYVYGRRTTRVDYVDGQIVKRVGPPRPPEQARVCLHNHHPPYISWERFQANQAKISDARPRWKMDENRGAIREGLALLTGLIRCGHCGRKLFVSYKATSALYYCDGGQAKGTRRCLCFGTKLIDLHLGEQICRAVQPQAIEAAQLAYERDRQQNAEAVKQAQLQLEAAQYEADRAFEQYDLVDPKNRLVADTLEQRLNERLAQLQAARQHLAAVAAEHPPLTDTQRQQLLLLADDFSRAWNHPDAPVKLRKRLARAVIEEVIVVHLPDRQKLQVTIHFKGGIHTQLEVNKRATPVGSKADESLITTVRTLAQSLDDPQIARILNMKQTTTPRGLPWTQDRVRAFRKQHRIQLGQHTHDPDLLTGQQAADYLGISRNGLRALIRIGAVTNNQITDFAPWRISRAELDLEDVQTLVRILKTTGRLPRDSDTSTNQLTFTLDASSEDE